MGWLYVPELAESNSACELRPEDASAWCATSSGKPTLRPFSWRGWKTRPWITRLSGTILRPSTAARGVVWRIALLQGYPVSPIASRDPVPDTLTSERSGPNSFESLKSASQLSFLLRTSRHSSNTSSQSIAAYQAWVSGSHRRCYRPPRNAELRISETDSLSWLPTPTAQNYGTNQGGAAGRVGETRPSLEILMTSLPTPAARDWKSDHGQMSDAQMYGTKGKPLPRVVVSLPTPTAADYKASGAAGYSTESGRHSGTTLTDAVTGAASAGRNGKLNPRLSEWMMGFPAGWMSSEPLAMQSFPTWLRQRGLTSSSEYQDDRKAS